MRSGISGERMAAGSPQIEFVFWRHIESSVKLVLPHLEEADVILVESSPLAGKRQKLATEAIINLVTGSPLDKKHEGVLRYEMPEADTSLITYENEHTQRTAGILFSDIALGIFHKFHDTGKYIRWLDTNSKDYPQIAESLIAHVEEQKASNNAIQNREITSFDEVIASHRSLHEKMGKLLVERDKVIVGQINEQLEIFPDSRVAVVYGANHSPISHPFLADGSGKRIFITENQANPPAKYHYNLDAQAQRRARFNKPIPDALIIRLLMKGSLQLVLAEDIDPREIAENVRLFNLAALSRADKADLIAAEADESTLEAYYEIVKASLRSGSPEDSQSLNSFLKSQI